MPGPRAPRAALARSTGWQQGLAGSSERVGRGLDRIADLAARLLEAGSAQVVVLTDVQRVVAAAGAAAATRGAVTPLDEAWGALVVGHDGPVVVTDTAADPRTAGRGATDGGPGRAAAAFLAVPLHAADGLVGALCVSAVAPREWSAADVSLLDELAGAAASELELGALLDAYEDERLVWQLAVDAAGVGAFDWNLTTGELRWDDSLLDLFGLDRSSFGGTIEAFDARVHPDDLPRVTAALDTAVETCGMYEAEYRVVRPDGATRWLNARGHAIAGPEGTAVRLLGAAYDTTAVREGESRVARVLESMSTAFYQLDTAWRFSYLNAEAERVLGRRRGDLVGRVVWEEFPDAVGNAFEDSYRRALATGEPVAFEAYYPAPLDGWFEVRAWPSPDGLAVYFLDITERRHAQEALERAATRTRLLSDISHTLANTLDTEEAVERVPRLIVPAVADWCIVTLLAQPVEAAGDRTLARLGWRGRVRDAGRWHHDPERRAHVEQYAGHRLAALDDSAPLARAVVGRQPVLHRTDATEALLSSLAPGPARTAIEALAPRSAVFLPLRARGAVVGMLSAYRDPGRDPFDQEDLAALGDIANRVGLALDNARLFGQQRDLAAGLQRSMLTAPPAPDRVEVAVRYAPAAQAAQVGGDWYDAFKQADGATVLVIGDVLGHDINAAAAMGQTRSLLRGIAAHTGDGPAAVLRGLEGVMGLLGVDTLATAVVARLEEEERDVRLRWSNAGHLDPVLVAPDGTVRVLEPASRDPLLGTGLAIASARGTTGGRTEQDVLLAPGSTVVLCTDGLIERRGESIDRGLGRLTDALRELAEPERGFRLDELCDRLLERLVPDGADDDVALVAVRV